MKKYLISIILMVPTIRNTYVVFTDGHICIHELAVGVITALAAICIFIFKSIKEENHDTNISR